MELKVYQKNVIQDVTAFLFHLTEHKNISKAYNTLWNEKNVKTGLDGMPYYHSTIEGVPQVCIKVPTGGGKTLIAAAAIKPIFDAIPILKVKAVVWLVPSDAILSQTYMALTNADHPYRQKIDVAFNNRVEVYSKQQLLNGQNLNPTSVTEQLSIFVLSYDSFRTKNKDGRKAYQENGNLASFSKYTEKKDFLLDNVDETALMQVIRSLNPVVIVDESHHAKSELSIEMLQNFNPCFVLELTATPKEGSNIISYVDAIQLKKENMVKLPVIVYNRKSQVDVFSDAINIRAKLEATAKKEQESSGKYIRPIVLFQAEPKNNEDSTTYEKIKGILIDSGIPKEQIAIKTADKNELKNIDLLSPNCSIRFIITVNALNEGWDCPFAYILATVANRSSSVDVEQILGRILRLPYTKKNTSDVLNLSYVITSSSNFYGTLDKVVKGLNEAGFSSSDYRTQDVENTIEEEEPKPVQGDFLDIFEEEKSTIIELKAKVEESLQELKKNTLAEVENDSLLSVAISQNKDYEKDYAMAEQTATNLIPQEVLAKMNNFKLNTEFADEVTSLKLPQFMIKTAKSLFLNDEKKTLDEENLTKGFSLTDEDIKIDFTNLEVEMAKLDIAEGENSTAQIWKLKNDEKDFLKSWFDSKSPKIRLELCKDLIKSNISKLDYINDKELHDYIDRIVESLNPDQIAELEQRPYPYITKIKGKIISLVKEYCTNNFDKWLDQEKITCEPFYTFPKTISPTKTTAKFPKSLYSKEEQMNIYEEKVVFDISSLDNIKWWHRNISRTGFAINGSVKAYPDMIAMTQKGKILVIETKGSHLDGSNSKIKAKLGSKWASLAGKDYRYFMVFETSKPDYEGAYVYDRFMEIVREL